MTTKKKILPRRVAAAAFALAVLALAIPAHALTYTWDGGNATTNNGWGNAQNWDPDGAPASANDTDLVFDVLTRPNNFIGANRTIRSISYGANITDTFQSNYQDFAGGAARNLTMSAPSGNAAISVAAGASGNITLGNAGGGGGFGNMILSANLDVDHNGSGLLLFNRPIGGSDFGITKTGNGTMQTNSNNTFTGAININQGSFIGNSFNSTLDINNASAITLGGGTLEIRANFTNKNYTTVPVNVTAASTLTYNNVNDFNQTAQFTGNNSFDLNNNLTIRNISSNTTLVSALNIARSITGPGNVIVETNNNIASSSDNFILRRVLFSGNNTAWNGDLTVARGTISLAGNATNAAGNGVITIGTASDAFGAGVTFFPEGPNGSGITYHNNLTVTTGGFRAIKGGNTDHNVTFAGDVTVNGDLTVDHTWSATDRRIWFSGNISGAGGLTITRAGGNAGTATRLSGANTYLGNTTVTTNASLVATGSLTSNISVDTAARFGGNGGSTTGNLTMAAGANFIFNISSFATFNVSGSVTLDNSFGVASLIGGSQGEAIDWSLVPAATYTLIGTTASTFNHITNFGLANAAVLGGGKSAYFQNGGGLQLVVTGGDPYETWSLQITNPSLRDRALDADFDGWTNLQEFLFGTSPIAGNGALTSSEKSGADLIIRWKELVDGGSYTLKESVTLGNDWVNAIEALIENDGAVSGDYQPRKATIAIGSGKKFFRVEGVEN